MTAITTTGATHRQRRPTSTLLRLSKRRYLIWDRGGVTVFCPPHRRQQGQQQLRRRRIARIIVIYSTFVQVPVN